MASFAQEQIDKLDASSTKLSSALVKMSVRVRVGKASPTPQRISISWKHGGEGLGGDVSKGEFHGEDKQPEITFGAWSAWLPLGYLVGQTRNWEFVTVAVHSAKEGERRGGKKNLVGLEQVVVDFEFAENGKVFKTFSETAPNGATVSFAFPGGALDEKGATNRNFVSQLQGLSSYVRARRERLEKLFPESAPLPKQFGIVGHVGGYGEGTGMGKGEGSGYGVHHCNPEILADECRTLRLLGVNGMVGSVGRADRAGFSNDFRRVYFGGPGSGSPMGKGKKSSACPFDPAVKDSMNERVAEALAEHRRVGAQESWAEWWDEIGVAAKDHLQNCPRCATEFRNYLRSENLQPKDFGKNSWEEISPYKIFDEKKIGVSRSGKKKEGAIADAPTNPADALRFYYTFRFMTYATAKLFPEVAQKFKAAGIPLFAMQGPTPSWSGASLDWNEFYDLSANTAIVFETSNRDPQVWQMESYLSDIAHGIAERHNLKFGCLIKPHRGAPLQRMLSVVSRGATVFEWYTYGPDYAKGDSFSARLELLEAVARGGRFLGRAEEFLYGAKLAGKPEVAFVSPRSSEIWGKATELSVTAFEDAKWVYLALAHSHVPVDVLSEQQLAEGKLDQYKVIYVVGPNLRRDAAAKIREWVRDGGTLWTDALGLSRDEANQPAAAMNEMLGVKNRTVEKWGEVQPYRAINLQPFAEEAPKKKSFTWQQKELRPVVGRELCEAKSANVMAKFSDGEPAVVRNSFGKGQVILTKFWAGLSYSAGVREKSFNLRNDFDSEFRLLIAGPLSAQRIYRPVIPAEPLVEAILLEKDGQRSIALMNWAYSHGANEPVREHLEIFRDLPIDLSHVGELRKVRSLTHGPLRIANNAVILPSLEEIDLLILN